MFASTAPCRAARCLVTALALSTSAAHAQSHLAGGITAGYAAGLDSPVFKHGSIGVNGTVWLERRSGIEFGFGAGYDKFEDRTLVTPNLFREPSSGIISSQNCPGCVAGSYEQRDRQNSLYLTPMLRIRARTGAVRPYASVGVGLYGLHEPDEAQFVVTGGGSGPFRTENVQTSWTGGGNLMVGVTVPVGARVSLDFSSQLHGAVLVGNDYAGGAGYGKLAAGIAFR